MELNHLRAFFEVAKAGSFTAAARQLHISQSALSKAVALLEESEGVKLLERSKKGVALTPVGTEVYRMSNGIFQTVTAIQDTCRGTKEVCQGEMRFGVSDHVMNYLLIERLRALREAHPAVIPSPFSGTPHEIVGLILGHELEFGLFFTKLNVPGINYESITKLPMTVVCHPKQAAGVKGSDLARLRKVVAKIGFISSIRSQYSTQPSQGFMEITGTDVPIALQSNSQEAQKRFCLTGGGVAYLARFMVEDELRSGKLVELKTPKPLSTELWLARGKGVSLSLSARTFLRELNFPAG